MFLRIQKLATGLVSGVDHTHLTSPPLARSCNGQCLECVAVATDTMGPGLSPKTQNNITCETNTHYDSSFCVMVPPIHLGAWSMAMAAV